MSNYLWGASEHRIDKARGRIETSAGGIAILAGVAMLDLAFEDFPQEIPLPVTGAFRLSAIRANGKWRIDGDGRSLITGETSMIGDGKADYIALSAMKAMNMPQTPENLGKVAAVLRQSPADEETLGRIFKLLPRRTVVSSLSLGDRALLAFGVKLEDFESFQDAAFRAAIRTGANLNAADSRRGPPLLLVLVQKGNLEAVNLSLSKGYIRANAAYNGHTAARLAVTAGRPDMIEVLRRHGERFNGVDNLGNTLLHIAAMLPGSHFVENGAEIARLLVEEGADPAAVNASGETAAEVVHMYQAPRIVPGRNSALEGFLEAVGGSGPSAKL